MINKYLIKMKKKELKLWMYHTMLIVPACNKVNPVFLSGVVQLMNQSLQWISKMFCICIIWVKMIIGINLISASYLIKYAHHGRSCLLNIFGMPESILCIRALKFCFLKALKGHIIYDDIKDIIFYIITSVSKNRTKIGYPCADHLTLSSLISHIVSDFNDKIIAVAYHQLWGK